MARLALFPWTAIWALANRYGWLGATPVGNHPHLDPEALENWRHAVANSTTYLEYGSGGSTVEAVQTAKHVFSVETDGRFLANVERKVDITKSATANFHPIYVDIGWTGKWGRPLFPWPSARRVSKWRRYSAAPWKLLYEQELVPDFIFIDGRFRVASVLESFLRLPESADCLFMLDDFATRRQQYGAALAFAMDVKPAGRAMTFRRDPAFNRAECLQQLEKFQADPE